MVFFLALLADGIGPNRSSHHLSRSKHEYLSYNGRRIRARIELTANA